MTFTPEFSKLYEGTKHRVYRTVLSYLQNPEDAEEVTQDVYVEVFRKAGSFKGESNPETWIYRIAVNKCLDFLKHKNRKKRFAFFSNLYHEDSGELKTDKGGGADPQLILENKELLGKLSSAIGKLNQQQRTAIILIFVSGLSYKEASEIMDCSVKALESLVQRARQNLKKEIFF